jgi:hypothetical protein
MLVNLHHFDLSLDTNSARIASEWARLYAPFAADELREERGERIPIRFSLDLVPTMPSPPAGPPAYAQDDLAVYPDGERFIIHLPRLGQLNVKPAVGRVAGVLVPEALDLYGAFENVNAIGLAPLLRRHGRILIHAFAAAYQGEGLLLVGESASGKTTTGLALLAAGWKLIANDSPILGELDGRMTAFAYPGLISAEADALRRIPGLAPLADDPALAPRRPGWKISLAAEEHFPSPWGKNAPLRAICLPQLDLNGAPAAHRLEALSPAVALGQLLAHSVDRWDQELFGAHVDILQALVQQAPTYRLVLGPQVTALPQLLECVLGHA